MYHSVKKRSMKNKLVAQSCKAVLMTNFTTSVITWRFLVGPVNENLSILILFIRNFDAVIMMLCFTEIIVFRCLLLFGWKHFNSTNEEFMFGFLSLFNVCFTFVTQLSRWMLGKYNAKVLIRKKKLLSQFLHSVPGTKSCIFE